MFISQTFDFIVFITLFIELIVLMINLSRCIKIIEDQWTMGVGFVYIWIPHTGILSGSHK